MYYGLAKLVLLAQMLKYVVVQIIIIAELELQA